MKKLTTKDLKKGWRWRYPYLNWGRVTWCGWFITLHAPICLSLKAGRGMIGLAWTLRQKGPRK